MDDVAIEAGSSNVFADLSVPDPEDMLLRSSLVIEIRRLIQSRGLIRSNAAEILDIGQDDLSELLGGQLRRYTVERLMRMLTAFDQDVDIIVRPRRAAGMAGRITVQPAAES